MKARQWLFVLGLILTAGTSGAQTVEMNESPVTISKKTARLTDNGKALMTVIVGEKASPRVREAAKTLADYLGRIGGAKFTIAAGDGTTGIVVGLPDDFTKLPFKVDFPGGPFGREDYCLRSTSHGVWLLGASELGVENAVWDLLYRLGYRQFFPGKIWEVVPAAPALSVDVDITASPAFYARRIWYGWGTLDDNSKHYGEWCARNRMVQGFWLKSGHAYENIVTANKAAFDAHPEYFALVKGQRSGVDAKFCISNPGLRKLVVAWAVNQVKADPRTDSLSLEPSDGDGWCECEACAKMGSISDHALTLANEAAGAINQLGLGDKYVGMYAYNRHGPPPSIKVDPHVIISTTTEFITGGFSLDQIIDGWKAKGATFGIYDYYSVSVWDWNFPGRAKAARPTSVASSIRDFHQKGARFYDCESGDCWGPAGLGYYIASRVMWDIKEADNINNLVDDFLTRAFGPAKEPMQEFYQLINFDTAPRSGSDMVGRMYRCLARARTLAADRPDVRNRIDHLILYTRYVELYNAFANSKDKQDTMMAFAWRMGKTMMVHAFSLWCHTIGQQAALNPIHPLKNDEPFTEAEIQTMLKQGIAANQPVEMGFTSIGYSNVLVPATRLKLPDAPLGKFPPVPQGEQTYFIWIPQVPAEIHLKVTVQKVWALRPHKITLFSPNEVTGKPVDESGIVKPDGQTYDVVLHTTHVGLHRVEIVDGNDYTRITWPEGMPITLPTGIDMSGVFVSGHWSGVWTLYCYVPKGTKIVGGWAARHEQWASRISGTLKDGDGNVVYDFGEMDGDGYFSVPVPPGQDGKLWQFENTQGVRQLMTVPPYLARNAQELLLPKEVVEKDAR